MGLGAAPPVGVPVPKRTLRGTLVGAEGFTSRSAPLAFPFSSRLVASLTETDPSLPAFIAYAQLAAQQPFDPLHSCQHSDT